MRGAFVDQGRLFSYVSPEARVPSKHPLREIRTLVREVLSELNRSFGKLYSSEGRPSIPPEQLLSALLLQVFYGTTSTSGTSGRRSNCRRARTDSRRCHHIRTYW